LKIEPAVKICEPSTEASELRKILRVSQLYYEAARTPPRINRRRLPAETDRRQYGQSMSDGDSLARSAAWLDWMAEPTSPATAGVASTAAISAKAPATCSNFLRTAISGNPLDVGFVACSATGTTLTAAATPMPFQLANSDNNGGSTALWRLDGR
jgi:hypothetical protein